MKAAVEPRTERDAGQLLVVDPTEGRFEDAAFAQFPTFLRRGDLLVVNDAATLPASLKTRTPSGEEIELRLLCQVDGEVWDAVLFGAGDWRIATELRDPPVRIEAGTILLLSAVFTAEVIAVTDKSHRLVTVAFNRKGAELWAALYAHGKPVQYSYLTSDLKLWLVLPRGVTCANPFSKTVATRQTFTGNAVLMCS